MFFINAFTYGIITPVSKTKTSFAGVSNTSLITPTNLSFIITSNPIKSIDKNTFLSSFKSSLFMYTKDPFKC